jgi:nucleotide-binding universal stress UspA family protein
MFEDILIAADNSELILNGAEYASILFPKSTFHALSVIDTRDRSIQLTRLPFELKEKYCKESVESCAKILEEKKINVLKVVNRGVPWKEILRYIEKNNIKLLLIATHAFSGVKKLHIGKTCRAVLERVKIPALLFSAPAELKIPAKILNPSTGTKYSRIATEIAMKLAKMHNSTVTTLAFGKDKHKHELEGILEHAEKLAKFYGVDFKGIIIKPTEESILDYFKNHDLCIGSRASKSILYHFRAIYRDLALDRIERETIVESTIPILLIGD